ncbi:MAG: DEAD/DEAH box helicase [Nanoarchaeota archaeon]|nr:DEAD/DEAH box helicase [Nanoarchaeota archaeon]
MEFKDLKINSELLRVIEKLGFTNPTEIQEVAIPHIVAGKDVIGESATGSGKTLAFGAGLLRDIKKGAGIQALIMTPTRELAEQVKGELVKLSDRAVKITSIYGGVAINPQMDDLTRAEVVVATPGRLLDHMQRGTIDLSKVKVLVLDEADRMLDMGFIDDVEIIIKECPKNRQTLFFSATISEEIWKLAHKYMVEPVRVSAKRHVDPKKLKQVYYDVPRNLKIALLIHLLKEERKGLVMVFCNSRKNVDFVVKNLKVNGLSAIAIHGGFSQNKRSKTMEMFNNAKVGVLVCTDVAARGLHVNNVSHVYNYDIPKDPKDYVHRIGRTARAGEEGKAINLLCDFDHDNMSRIFRDYDFNIPKEKRPYLERVTIKTERSSYPRNNNGPRLKLGAGRRRRYN